MGSFRDIQVHRYVFVMIKLASIFIRSVQIGDNKTRTVEQSIKSPVRFKSFFIQNIVLDTETSKLLIYDTLSSFYILLGISVNTKCKKQVQDLHKQQKEKKKKPAHVRSVFPLIVRITNENHWYAYNCLCVIYTIISWKMVIVRDYNDIQSIVIHMDISGYFYREF